MSRYTRRRFLETGAKTSLAFSLFTVAGTKASGNVLGANDRIRIGVAGINGRGKNHLDDFARMDGVDVTYLIDPDSRLFDDRSQRVTERGGNVPTCVQDIRTALDDDNLDAVSVATCNHWHSLITIWACQAGKDVYVEKPLSHNVFEGRKAVEAARRYNRLVQHGTQQRSSIDRAKEIAAVQSGEYGKLLVSKGYCSKPRWSIGYKPIATPPAELDFNLWLGPAPEQAFHENLVHYNWHWFWDTGNGDTGNQGVHEMDVARWAIKGATMPERVWSLGGRFAYDDQGQTPNTQLTVFDYGETKLVFETRGLVGEGKFPGNVSNEYYTEAGLIKQGKLYPKGGGDPELLIDAGGEVTPGGTFGSFIAAVRSRNVEDLNADVAEGHYSSALCHLSNISYRLGEPMPYDKASGKLGDNKVVVDAFQTIKDNLGAVNVDLTETDFKVGPVLEFDAENERFIDNDAANALLSREYREPFVVPEVV